MVTPVPKSILVGRYIKFLYSEKPTKFEEIAHFSLTLLSNAKKKWLNLRKSIAIADCQDETQVKPHLFFSIFFFVTCGGCRADLEIGGRRAETTLIILNISTSNFVANNLPDF